MRCSYGAVCYRIIPMGLRLVRSLVRSLLTCLETMMRYPFPSCVILS